MDIPTPTVLRHSWRCRSRRAPARWTRRSGGEWFWLYAPAVLAQFVLPISFAYAMVTYRVIEIPRLLERSARSARAARVRSAGGDGGLVATGALVRLFPLLAPNRPDLAGRRAWSPASASAWRSPGRARCAAPRLPLDRPEE
jgi:hypothetical protein